MSANNEFGSSQLYDSERLNFNKRPCRDCFCAVIYYLHVIGVAVATMYIFAYYADEIHDKHTPAPSTVDENSLDWTGVYVAIPVCAASGLLFGLIWLQIMRVFSSFIIKLMLIANCIAWIILFIIACVELDKNSSAGNIAFVVCSGFIALFWCLYAWCVWPRVPFSTALLKIASVIAGAYPATTFIAIIIVCFDLIWLFLWGSMLFGYIIVATEDDSERVYGWIIFLMLISLYWGCCVNSNIGHTTYCGVAAVWYFSADTESFSPSFKSFGRAMSTQFGSICLGSIFVAILEAIKSIINSVNNDKCSCIRCCVICCLSCVEWMIRYFNKYAYAHCAIYGASFVRSASITMQLFESNGIMALINDDLTGSVLFVGGLFSALVTAAIGYGIGFIFYKDDSDWNISNGIPVGLAVYGGVIGLILCLCVLTVVQSSIVTLFVCFAEEPQSMATNHKNDYLMLVRSHKGFSNVSEFVPQNDAGASLKPV